MGQTAARVERDHSPPTGTVTLTVEIEVPVEAVVQYWTKDEAAALVAGDDEARSELFSQACGRREAWSGFDVLYEEVKFHG